MISFWMWIVFFAGYTILGCFVFSLALNEDGKPDIFAGTEKWRKPFRVMFNLSFVYFWPVYLALGLTIGSGCLLWEAIRAIFK